MATVKQCDRCKTIWKMLAGIEYNSTQDGVMGRLSYSSQKNGRSRSLELCPTCETSLLMFLDNNVPYGEKTKDQFNG